MSKSEYSSNTPQQRSDRELDLVVNRMLDNLQQAHVAVTASTGYDPEKYSSTYSEAASLIRRLRGLVVSSESTRLSPDKLLKVITDAQAILATYIVPDSGISDHECINRLLGLLDGPQTREALATVASSAIAGWTSLSDQLPEPYFYDEDKMECLTEVLGFTIGGAVRTEYAREMIALYEDAKRNDEACFWTHWMPMPIGPTDRKATDG